MSTEILIIDDNPDIRNILKDLISDAGYETRIAANYNQALNEISIIKEFINIAIPSLTILLWGLIFFNIIIRAITFLFTRPKKKN